MTEGFDGFVLIHAYTRKQALEDGELVDMSVWASASRGFIGGFKVPVAFTRSLYEAVRNIPEDLKGCANVRGRSHDVLFMAALALKGALNRCEHSALFEVFLPTKSSNVRVRKIMVHIGPGDLGETVVTIGFPEDF